jgi:hypothetical protein
VQDREEHPVSIALPICFNSRNCSTKLMMLTCVRKESRVGLKVNRDYTQQLTRPWRVTRWDCRSSSGEGRLLNCQHPLLSLTDSLSSETFIERRRVFLTTDLLQLWSPGFWKIRRNERLPSVWFIYIIMDKFYWSHQTKWSLVKSENISLDNVTFQKG